MTPGSSVDQGVLVYQYTTGEGIELTLHVEKKETELGFDFYLNSVYCGFKDITQFLTQETKDSLLASLSEPTV